MASFKNSLLLKLYTVSRMLYAVYIMQGLTWSASRCTVPGPGLASHLWIFSIGGHSDILTVSVDKLSL